MEEYDLDGRETFDHDREGGQRAGLGLLDGKILHRNYAHCHICHDAVNIHSRSKKAAA